ncbi:MAG: thiamine ABC transporter substrate-binding protein, partial [Thermoplasmatota archaeon]
VTAVTTVLLAVALAGCTTEPEATTYAELGFDGTTWPDLSGQTVTILDHGAFFAFDSAAAAFQNLTNATVKQIEADDTGSALNLAVAEAGAPTFDVLYGIDNVLLRKAIVQDVFEPYRPLLAQRIDPDLIFFDEALVGWPATPVDHGYIAVNVDVHNDAMDNITISDLHDLRRNADLFVTQDPRFSTPGLGFLLSTIARFGESPDDGPYDWQDYWTDLFEGGVQVTSDWSTAYEVHFSGGYGIWLEGHRGDRPIVTSYSESPAYEAFYGAEEIADVLLDDEAVFHQIQTMGIARGTPNLAAAQAWIEFTLTDAFQELAAPENAVYPVVPAVSVNETYGGLDPIPEHRHLAKLGFEQIGRNVDRWVREWTDLCEEHDCA